MILPQFFDNPFQVRLSFHRLIERLESLQADETGYTTNVKKLLKDVSAHPELREGITDISQILDNSALITRLMAELFPPALSKNEIKAITIPYQGLMFNYTDRFRDILHDAGQSFEINIRGFDDHQFYVLSCCLILNRFYGTNLDFTKPLFYDIPTADGVLKHYRILYNADFMEIMPAKEVPALSDNDIKYLLDNYDDLDLWKTKFPAGSWFIKGFTIMTLVDVTVENALSILKDNLLGEVHDTNLQQSLESIFQSIFKISDLKLGFTSFNEEKGLLSNVYFGQKIRSFILLDKREDDMANIICNNSFEYLIKDHSFFAVSDTSEFLANNPDSYLAKIFKAQHAQSFILAPVIKNETLLGFLELVSPRIKELNSVNANRLEIVMPFLVDTIDRKLNEFQNRVQAVIQNNYTTLHPSVNWKFEREAKNYIQNDLSGLGYNLKEITFKNVYPFYGQVDIQNSSITRNLSVKSDLIIQLNVLVLIVEQLQPYEFIANAERHLAELKSFIDELSAGVKADTEQSIQHYLEINIYPLLQAPGKFSRELTTEIDGYFKQTDRLTGEFYANRRNYEKTLSLVNSKLIDIIDKRQTEIQKFYPHYYERFKTDGVDHSLYIGKAITPDVAFDEIVLRRLRLWQLLVIAEMEMEQYRLKSELPYHLGVTTLILVFSTPIDIRFRMDEKHFDIDGAYNIRYEVIKKRIDKAHVKNTQERITAKGKITIVYSKAEEEEEYLNFIEILKSAAILGDEIERFDIEELQGVSGLKGLRVNLSKNPELLINYTPFYNELYKRLA